MFTEFLLSTVPLNKLDINRIRLVNPLLLDQLDELIDIIKARLFISDLEKVSTSLLPKLFKIRLDLIRTVNTLEIFEEVLEETDTLVEEIPNKQFAIIIRDFQSISKHIINNPNPLPEIDLSKLEISYETLKYLSTRIPSFFHVKDMTDASLKVEFGIIVNDLLENNEINTNQEQLNEKIIPFIRSALSDFGINAILANLWNPTNFELNNPTFNRMKIKASIINSIKKEAPRPRVGTGWKSLFGAWKEDGTSADELILLIRNSRLSNRTIESLD